MDKNNLKISVLIPCHNIEKLSYFSLKSVVKNKYPNLEIIVLNDYSTDNTLKILHNWAQKDKRIKVYDLQDYNQHVGVGFNRDFLIQKATGDYFVFIDDDDKMSPKTIKEFANSLDKDYDIVSSKAVYCFEIAKNIRVSLPNFPYFKNYDVDDPKDFFLHNPLFAWGKLIKKEYYLNICEKYNICFSEHDYEDIRMTYLLFLSNPKHKFLNKKLFTYQMRKNSLSSRIIDWKEKIDKVYNAYSQTFLNILKFKLLDNNYQLNELKNLFIISIYLTYYGLNKIIQPNQNSEFIDYCAFKISEFKRVHNIDALAKNKLAGISKVVYNLAIKKYEL
ncbi:Poly-beta-1,6-N-acetyl-D-glucosamine synthase [Mycoplasmopsis bovigenitalium]|uniref:Poly-beta-1,6-N-acetyl-D-glucosamine synthase n=1 Tax=Mycoplasmopsis bovigenitalium TaxID=2112 RepID=A0A449A9L7_9BACT|nr:glycosyltransferase family 2 protein [Mycoplasmopsis bovigenitalium]VEU60880.1 Poly-beta-1,6-N-acetyl-D-glucosamine synthase [Mycoplasmopsis bovigenitalium]